MFLILILIIVFTSFYYIHRHYQYWLRLGIPGPKPKYIFGNMKESFFMQKSTWEIATDIYRSYPNEKIVGIFRAFTPALIVRDPEIIKDIFVKSFNYFVDNDNYIDKMVDIVFGRNLFFLKGSEWKEARSQLTPAFTSVKMKWIYPHLECESQNLVKFLKAQPAALNGEGYEGKELCMRFTLNNVATCAFGLDGKCFEEHNSEFKQIADKFLTPNSIQSLKYFLLELLPILSKVLTLKIVNRDIEEKLINIVSETLRFRKENNIIRNDFLHILQELRETELGSTLSDVDITGLSASFFVDGYDTSSLVMSFILYDLACNPEAQAKLRQEVSNAFDNNDNNMPYDVLQELCYLDAVFNESLRLHPVLGSLKKVCTKPYRYQPKEDDKIKSFIIEPGTKIVIPLYGLQLDEKYFDNPMTFCPERFIDSNLEKNNKYVFMPFGVGPRVCLGQKFGILQVKIGVAYIIKNFEVFVNKKTLHPLKYDPVYWLTTAEGGLWLDYKSIA